MLCCQAKVSLRSCSVAASRRHTRLITVARPTNNKQLAEGLAVPPAPLCSPRHPEAAMTSSTQSHCKYCFDGGSSLAKLLDGGKGGRSLVRLAPSPPFCATVDAGGRVALFVARRCSCSICMYNGGQPGRRGPGDLRRPFTHTTAFCLFSCLSGENV